MRRIQAASSPTKVQEKRHLRTSDIAVLLFFPHGTLYIVHCTVLNLSFAQQDVSLDTSAHRMESTAVPTLFPTTAAPPLSQSTATTATTPDGSLNTTKHYGRRSVSTY